MPVRNAFRMFLIPVAVMTMTGPAFAKYTEEWVHDKDGANTQAATHGGAHPTAAAAHSSGAAREQGKAKVSSSPFASDPIAAFADDPIAAFARSRTK